MQTLATGVKEEDSPEDEIKELTNRIPSDSMTINLTVFNSMMAMCESDVSVVSGSNACK